MRRLALALAALLIAAAVPVVANAVGWIATCQYSHSGSNDPIVFPNQPGASHLHDFFGAITTNAASTLPSLRASSTTCVMPDDPSGYWTPALYEGGQRRLPTGQADGAAFYYQRIGIPNGGTVQPTPAGLKMVVGNANAMSPGQNPMLGGNIYFKCGPGDGARLPSPPTSCPKGVLVISVIFPNCWDGVNLDSPNHISHMAYPVMGCPPSHPVNIPRLQAFFRYKVGQGPIGTITLASGSYFTMHADFFNAWENAAMASLTARCLNVQDCGINPQVP